MMKIILILVVAICLTAADPIRQKPLRRRLVSARQQLEESTVAPTGYPPAGVTPDVPFELPTEAQEPDTVYGPPEAQPDVVYGPPETPAQEPDTVYGPPESETNPDIAEDIPEEEELPLEEEEEEAQDIDDAEDEVLLNEDGSVISISTTFDQGNLEEKPARLVYQRFPQRRQPPAPVPARLMLANTRNPTNFLYTPRLQRL